MSSTLFARGAIPSAAPPRKSPRSAGEAWLDAQMKRMKAIGRFADFGDLTPEIAEVLLQRNPANRHIVGSNVDRICGALRSGDWEPNGSSIVISDTGELNDGQHRCTAVIATGVSMPVLFVFGTPRESRKTLDQGAKKEPGHIFAMAGVLNAALSAAAVRCVLNIEADVALATMRATKELERGLAAHPDILVEMRFPLMAAAQFKQSGSPFVAIHYLSRQKNGDKATEFFEILASGAAPSGEHPVALLRKRLTENLGGKARLPRIEVAALLIKALNAFLAGRKVKALRWVSGGESPEAFPKVA